MRFHDAFGCQHLPCLSNTVGTVHHDRDRMFIEGVVQDGDLSHRELYQSNREEGQPFHMAAPVEFEIFKVFFGRSC